MSEPFPSWWEIRAHWYWDEFEGYVHVWLPDAPRVVDAREDDEVAVEGWPWCGMGSAYEARLVNKRGS